MRCRRAGWLAPGLLVLALSASPAGAEPDIGPLSVSRASGPIKIDGDLSDPGWRDAHPIDRWFETNPGDNVPPKVSNRARLAYDDKFFYAAFEFEDPEPAKIRAPFGDRDNISGGIDYGGVILDTRNDGKTGVLLLATPRGVQYDAISNDTTGNEDSSLDLYWDSAARITDKGWVLEMRVPFSSLRYAKADPQTWGILLYRNWPREFRYQMFSSKLPRGGNCFICNEAKLTGLAKLPTGAHMVLAPFVTAADRAGPSEGLGSPLRSEPVDEEGGLDFKWVPNAATAVDLTANPDFSQIESDVAQIGVNERFALFFPERRPFFLEGLELYATPIQAVYTRAITSPRWGARTTGKLGSSAYTVMLAQDLGGGSVILPGANDSNFAAQDFRSWVALGRLRHDVGKSAVGVLVTDREVDGGGHNRVVGPDFQWRPSARDNLTGQVLWSQSLTPTRPDLAAEWDGRGLSGHAADVWYSHTTKTWDGYAEYQDIGEGFRADDGFVPQAGFRKVYGEGGRTFRPQGFVTRVRTFAIADRAVDSDGRLLDREFSAGTGMDARWNTFLRLRYSADHVRAGDSILPRQRLLINLSSSPSRYVTSLGLDGAVGQEVDFAGARRGDGADLQAYGSARPGDHLELAFNLNRRWLNVDGPGGRHGRLFTARVSRLRATYTLSSRAYVRAIGQYVATTRDPSLSLGAPADPRSGDFAGSLLFSYKLNWQTVLFFGYGDNRTLDERDSLKQAERQIFFKLSYALQR